ncbi:hypothetical protein [Sphingomonas prati]|uniref:hypothetical protein n=1 Tax=Sphingomonas prati TaxID=1843237 RepID=UPI0018DFDF6D|nr:hypothetical protein [Sphingomonas prati]
MTGARPLRHGLSLLLLNVAGTAAGQGTTSADALARSRALTGAATPCPRQGVRSDSITVCGRRTEELYRIPDVIRAEPQPRKAGAATAWGTRNAWAEEAARSGRPDSSSPDGAGGQSGLMKQMRREWELERQAIEARRETKPELEPPLPEPELQPQS